MKFVAEMRKNNFPNAGSFAKLLRQADVNENIPCKCSSRTIMRDIETLKNDYGAPIEYDPGNRGYFLLNPSWELTVPILSDDVLSMSILGAKLASDILPEPVRGDVNSAVEKALSGNSSSFFDDAMIESILCATGIKAAVDPAIFKKIFDAWRLHQVVELAYRKPNGQKSVRKFEPHIVAFHHGVWYAKGYAYRTKDVKVYAIQRITEVAFADDAFETDKKLVEETRANGIFVYPRIDGIRLRCDASIAFYLYEHQRAKKFRIEPQTDGSLIITLKPAFEHEVIRWILGEGGKIEVLEPAFLREKVAAAGKLLWERNREPDADVEPATEKHPVPASKAKSKKVPAKATSPAAKKRTSAKKK
jgi:predicted DNA-binding transcriptional regulator YafY